jgi:hypothetical protein
MSEREPANDVRASKMRGENICLDVKLQVFRRLEGGKRQADVRACSFKLGNTHIRTITKNKKKIQT